MPQKCGAQSTFVFPIRPDLARTIAASVKQRIAFGERAGQNVRRISSGFGYEGERPELTGPRCARVNGFSLHANTPVPAYRRDQLERLLRYTGRGAVSLERLAEDANGELVYTFTKPWSDGKTGFKLSSLELLEKLATIIPTPRQQGVDGEEAKTGTPYWSWARLLGRVFDLDMAMCPLCRRGSLRIIAAMTPGVGHHAHPTSSQDGLRPTSYCVPARLRQETFDWVD